MIATLSRQLLVIAALAAVSCGSGSESGPGSKTGGTAAEPLAPLASFAPENWMAAVIIADGSIQVIDAAADEMRRIVTDADAGQLLDQARSLFMLPGPIDPLDPSSHEAIGINTKDGVGLFLTDDFQVFSVFSVSDREKLRNALGAPETVGGDQLGSSYCAPARGRYLCASSKEKWTPVADAAQTSLEPPGSSTDVLFAARAPGTGDLVSTLGGPIANIRALRSELVLDAGRATVVANIDTTEPAGWLEARRRRLPRVFTDIEKGAFGFVRARIPTRLLRRLPFPKKGPIDLAEVLLPELTGDLALVSSGSHPLGLHAVAGLKNGGAVRTTLRTGCRLASFAGFGSFGWRNGRCEGKLDLRKLGAPREVLVWLPSRLPVYVSVDADKLVLSIMVPPKPGSAIEAASGPIARRIHKPDWNISGWGRWSDPEVVLTGRQAQRFRDILDRLRQPELVRASRALLAHVYDAGFGLRATTDGLHIEGSLTTFAADEDAAYRAYSGAAVALARGDVPKYIRGVVDVSKRYPRSLASRQNKVRGIPLAPLAGLGALLEQLGIR